MNALDYLYFIIYYGNRSKQEDKRFNPAAMIVLAVSPIIDAIFGLAVGPVGSRPPLVQDSEVLYARYDVFTYCSIAISALIAWRLFDRRRSEIIKAHQNFAPSKTTYFTTVITAFCFILVATYLSTRSSILAVLFSCVALGAGGMLAKRIAKVNGQVN